MVKVLGGVKIFLRPMKKQYGSNAYPGGGCVRAGNLRNIL